MLSNSRPASEQVARDGLCGFSYLVWVFAAAAAAAAAGAYSA